MLSITDELRKLAADPLLGYASQEQHVERLTEIADAIEKELVERYAALPLDADGVPIHVGDEMVGPYLEPSHVDGVGVGVFFVYDSEATYHGYGSRCYHHYQSDSWERIIRDAVEAGRCEEAINVMPLIERCKTLAGDA